MTRVGFWFLIGVTAWTCWAAADVPLGEERAYALSAQKAARFPVIIVFDENAPSIDSRAASLWMSGH